MAAVVARAVAPAQRMDWEPAVTGAQAPAAVTPVPERLPVTAVREAARRLSRQQVFRHHPARAFMVMVVPVVAVAMAEQAAAAAVELVATRVW